MPSLAYPRAPLQVNLRCLRAVRILSLCTLFAILVPWYASLLLELRHMDRANLFVPLFFFPFWLPCLWVWSSLREPTEPWSIKKALALAVAFSAFILACVSLLLRQAAMDGDLKLFAIFGLLASLQAANLGYSVKAYYSMIREALDGQILATRFVVSFLCIVTYLVIIPFRFGHGWGANEASAVGSLRSIGMAQDEYASTHPGKGYAASLADLGPSPGTDSINGVLASGVKSGYAFTMSVAPQDSDGRITTYAVAARPQRYETTGKRSFFLDQSGTFRYTTENRAPTAQDPPLL